MDDAASTPEPHNGEALAKEGVKWMERIRASEKREEKWRDDAFAAEAAFANNPEAGAQGKDSSRADQKLYDFNILHSNVETIVPAIYNSTPIPDVRRRWTEEPAEAPQPPQMQEGQPPDPRALMAFQQAMQAYQQKALLDKDTKALGDLIERAIVVQIDDNKLDTEIEQEAQDAFLAGRGIIRIRFKAEFQGEQPTNERLAFEVVSWRDYRQGPAKRWDGVPWVAYRHVASREAIETSVADKDMLQAQATYTGVPTREVTEDEDDIAYWEIWCKSSKQVKFVREHDSAILKTIDDPLGLSGFFPQPAPVQPITLTGRMTPVNPFAIYKRLADELDNITKRINKIMQGLKVRGIIAGEASKLVALAEADDNEIRVETDLEGLAQTGGLEKAIMWWPVEQAVKVLKELYVQREQVKASIYEITGISDIVRGASNAGETATAQQIKTQWGSLRIQKMQRMIERQVRDVFGLMAEMIVSKFSEPTLYRMTGIEITDGMRAMMQEPVFASYRIDVESDSTVRADLTRQKQDMTEFLAGTGNYFGTMAPLVEQAPEMAEPVAEIYASMARVFKLGKSAEDALERMKQIAKQAATTPRPNPEAEAVKAEQEAKAADRQAEMQMKEREFQMKEAAETRKAELDAQTEQRKIAVEQQKAAVDLQVAQVNLQIKQVELQLKQAEAGLKLETMAASNEMKLDAQRESNAIKAEQARQKPKEKADVR